MGAAKRLYDNSYNERLETAASAMAYLDTQQTKVNETKNEMRETSDSKSSFLYNFITVIGSLVYCVLILGLILMPLIKETQLHKTKVSFSVYKTEKIELEREIVALEAVLVDKINIANIKKRAKEELGLQNVNDTQTAYLNNNSYFSLNSKNGKTEQSEMKNVANENTNKTNDY